MSYPKWIYHKTEQPKIVQTKEEHDSLKGDWKEVPFESVEKQVEAAEKPQTSETEENHTPDVKAPEAKVILRKSKKAHS
jgi:hypothetical protein